MPDASPGSRWAIRHTVFLLVTVVAMVLVGLLLRTPGPERLAAWLAELALLGLVTVVIGEGVTGRAAGILIGERNTMSLSRLQLVLWTLIVLSAFFTAALGNLGAGDATPLAIEMPSDLWWLMGISTTSLVGSPLILSTKRRRPSDAGETARTLRLLAADEGVAPAEIEERTAVHGQVLSNSSPDQARLSDVFRGEEVGNAAIADLGKVQMFYFTLLVALAYAAALGSLFGDPNLAEISAFPELDESLIALLGISHAGYLTHKAVPHSAPPGVDRPPGGDRPAAPPTGPGATA